LTDIGNVVITTPSDNQFLRYDGTNWVNETVDLDGITTLSDLTDTDITSPTSGQILTYSQSISGWVNFELPDLMANVDLTDISDVNITTPADNQFLRYNGTEWVNETVAISSTTPTQDTAPASPSDGDLWWDSVNGKLKIYYDDGDSQQWVDASPTPASKLSELTDVDLITDTPTIGDILVFDGTNWIPEPKDLSITEITTSSTLSLSQAQEFLKCTNTSAITITIPTNSSVAFPTGTEIVITQYGTETVTIAPDTGVTMNSLLGHDQIAGQYGAATLKKIGTDEWLLIGALTASE
jgi:hypothetical protein